MRSGKMRGGGSIPACAGEPIPADGGAAAGRVYPRLCGGTDGADGADGGGLGLSPPVRGNRLAMPPKHHIARSIPACAGEPVSSVVRVSAARVYPRLCGGTLILQVMLPITMGLSPPVRGNRRPRG